MGYGWTAWKAEKNEKIQPVAVVQKAQIENLEVSKYAERVICNFRSSRPEKYDLIVLKDGNVVGRTEENSATGTVKHSLMVTKLKPGTEYVAVVKDASGSETIRRLMRTMTLTEIGRAIVAEVKKAGLTNQVYSHSRDGRDSRTIAVGNKISCSSFLKELAASFGEVSRPYFSSKEVSYADWMEIYYISGMLTLLETIYTRNTNASIGVAKFLKDQDHQAREEQSQLTAERQALLKQANAELRSTNRFNPLEP